MSFFISTIQNECSFLVFSLLVDSSISFFELYCCVLHRLDGECVRLELGGLRAVCHSDDNIDAACRCRDVVLRVENFGAAAVCLNLNIRETPALIE